MRTVLVFVRWFDSSITRGEMCDPEYACGVLDNESAGVLVREDKNSITIALDCWVQTGRLR